jgi:hypothetical protein
VGSYANLILYTLEAVAVIKYYSATKNNKDSPLVRTMVYSTFIVDTVSTIATCIAVYLYSITHWGDASYLQVIHWPSALVTATAGVSETIVQCFLIRRYWKMTENIYVTFVLTLLTLAAFGGAVGDSIVVLRLATSHGNQFSQRSQLKLTSIIWFSTLVAADISISFALLWELSRIKSPFKSTRSLVHKLMANTLSTGTLTSVTVIIASILFLADSESNVAAVFSYGSARLYALSMLYALNNRYSLMDGSMNTSDLAHGPDTSMNVANGVYVQRTAVTVHCGHSHGQRQSEVLNDTKDESDSFATQDKISPLPT